MNCREFRFAHLEYTDGTLGPAERAAAQAHADGCEPCARFDCLVRRSVLLVRNLPPVPAPSGSYQRLMARLAADAAGRRGRGRTTMIATATAAASIALVAGLVALSFRREPAPRPVAMAAAPVAARTAPFAPLPMIRRDLLAAGSSGMPLWPAASLLDEAPVRFVSAQPLPFASTR